MMWLGGDGILYRTVRKIPSDKMTFEQRSERSEGGKHANTERKSHPLKDTESTKALRQECTWNF